jgi:HEPN domain-containing protein
MTNSSLARSYLQKAESRLKTLPVLKKDKAYSDVVREAQEIVELALKGMLREIGVEPPKWHDVGSLLLEHKRRFEKRVAGRLRRLADSSKWLRRERELSFYGDIDFIPTEEYTEAEAVRAIEEATFTVETARWVIRRRRQGE